MINWRVASVPALKSNSVAALRGLAIGWPSVIPLPRTRTTERSVPWGWADLGRVLLTTALIGAGGAFALVLLGLALSLGFALAEGLGGLPSGTFDHLSALYGPYSAATTTLVVGGLLYGGLVFAVFRYSVARYRLPWSALGFRRLSRSALGRTAALFIPITLGGVVIMRIETVLLGSMPTNPQPALLTRGMPALPTNFLLLFLLLVVITPIAEEMFFRGFLFRLLRGHFPIWAAAPISAAAFAAMHGVPSLVPWLFYMGVVYAVLAERTGSLWASILVHALANGLVTLTLVVVLSGW